MKLNEEQIAHVENLLTTAIEGGSNYWYLIHDHNKKEVLECQYLSSLLANPKGQMTVGDLEEGFDTRVVTHADVIKAWNLFSTDKRYQKHYGDLLSENDDATTGDIFFQLVVLGEVVFG